MKQILKVPKKLKINGLAMLVILTFCFVAAPRAHAVIPDNGGSSGNESSALPVNDTAAKQDAAGAGTTKLPADDTAAKQKAAAESSARGGQAQTTPVGTDGTVGNDCADKDVKKCLENDKFIGILKTIVKFLSAGVGILVILSIIVGGIRYTVAGDDAAAVTAAKKQIYNAIFALVVFALTFSFLQWLIPGGIL